MEKVLSEPFSLFSETNASKYFDTAEGDHLFLLKTSGLTSKECHIPPADFTAVGNHSEYPDTIVYKPNFFIPFR